MRILDIFDHVIGHKDLYCIAVAAVISLIIIIVFYRKVKEKYAGIFPISYYKTDYYKQTRYTLTDVVSDAGRAGEYLVYRQLKRAAPENSRYLFNLYIPYGNGTTEIDMILITKKGIFVIESKYYSGKITGKQNADTWKECFKKKKKETFNFYNPIKQNSTHISILKEVLKNKDIPLFSLIVFSDKAKLSKSTKRPCSGLVMNCKDVLRSLRKILQKSPPVLTQVDVDNLYDSLIKFTRVSQKTKEEHIARILREHG